jgi:hypothetical protein
MDLLLCFDVSTADKMLSRLCSSCDAYEHTAPGQSKRKRVTPPAPDGAHSVASLRNLREMNTYTVRRYHFPQECKSKWVKQLELTWERKSIWGPDLGWDVLSRSRRGAPPRLYVLWSAWFLRRITQNRAVRRIARALFMTHMPEPAWMIDLKHEIYGLARDIYVIMKFSLRCAGSGS